MIRITWFLNPHEYRNHCVRLGLLRLAAEGKVDYRELPVGRSGDFGLSGAFARHQWRHRSLLLAEDSSGRRRTVLIDNEDGFVHLSGLIEECDLYFCSPYVPAFHRDRSFPDPYPWQQEEDVAEYRRQAAGLIERWGEHFGKVRPFAPTLTSMAPWREGPASASRPLARRLENLTDKAGRKFREALGGRPDQSALAAFAEREAQIRRYREGTILYDVVSRESLWGWPPHRVRLHRKLRSLAGRYRIGSQLTVPGDKAVAEKLLATLSPADRGILEELQQPIELGHPFEEAITHSRLAVFPTGFHWGWRGITVVCLCAGTPVLMDRPLYQPYFDFETFRIFFNDAADWPEIESRLESIDEGEWQRIREHNQAVFDRYLTPEALARYLVGSVEESITNG